MDAPLKTGSRVAVIGGGITGAAVAGALLHGARARGLAMEVIVYEAPPIAGARPPVLLSAECRSRLAALGCRVPLEWRVLCIDAVEVHAYWRGQRLPVPADSLWVGDSGTELVRRAISATAALAGARFVPRAVQRVDWSPPEARSDPPNAFLAVRAQGRVDRVAAAVLAAGPGGTLGDRFFPGFDGAPALAAVHARLRYALPARDSAVRLVLGPAPKVDALLLLPCGRSMHAVAYGARLSQTDFCQALMVACRDGQLRDGFELSGLRVAKVPFGAARRLSGARRLAVGPAACGHPLQLTLSEALSSCTRASAALLDAGEEAGALARRYVRDGVFDLVEDAVAAARATVWLQRARELAPEAFAHARDRDGAGGWSTGVLGLSSPTPRTLLGAARRAGLSRLWRSILLHPPPQSGGSSRPEPNLFFVVDDDDDTREALTCFIESRGGRVVAFSDELSLFAAAAQRPPAAILLDVVLSWVDGLRLCEGLKQHPATRNIRVVVISGLDRPHVRAKALEVGAAAFLPKPVDPPTLWAVLSQRPAAEAADVQPSSGPRTGGIARSGRCVRAATSDDRAKWMR